MGKTTTVLLALSLFLSTCGKSTDSGMSRNNLLMLILLMLNQSEGDGCASSAVADTVFERGFPGSQNTVSGEFPGIAGDYSVTIDSVAATGVTLPDATSLQFVMPTLSDVSANTTVKMEITRNGTAHLSRTVRYRPLLQVTVGDPNALFPRVHNFDDSVYFTFTAVTHTVSPQLANVQAAYPDEASQGYAQDTINSHIINLYGYSSSNLQIHSLANATAAFSTISEQGTSDSNFKKGDFTGNPIIRVKYAGGKCPNFKINVANGQVKAATSFDYYYDGFGLIGCYESQSGGTSANSSAFCANKNPSMTRVARCTYPSNTGITTRNYYSSGFGEYSAVESCVIPGNGSYNEMNAIAESN